jgi:ribosomal protein S18 acetylase RimI-like enzyme
LIDIYREGFACELAFFFRRFRGCFFEALFRLLMKDTIVAEAKGQVVGFIIAVLGLRHFRDIGLIRLMVTLPLLLASARPAFLIYILQKLRNTEWSKRQVGIGCVAVRRMYQGKGIGGVLMRKALAKYTCENATLEVRSWNESAIRLYKSVGFQETGAWRDPLGRWIAMSRRAHRIPDQGKTD